MSHPIKLAVLLPAVREPEIRGGGHLNTLRFAELLGEHCPVELVSYQKREDGVSYLPETETRLAAEGWTLLLTWGPHVAGHVERFHGRLPLVYYQQSLDWGFDLPADVPVISMSKSMAVYAQRTWPSSPQIYLPPVLPEDCFDRGLERDLDVLVVKRKMPDYLLDVLLPRLEARGLRVHFQKDFIPRAELYRLFNRARVYLYAFAPQRTPHTASGWRLIEGIATQCLEATVCGCTVLADLRGGHVDFVEPELFGHRLMTHSPAWDVEQVLRAVREEPSPERRAHRDRVREHYGEALFHHRARALLRFLEVFQPFAAAHPADAAPFGVPRAIARRERLGEKIVGTLSRLRRRLLPRPGDGGER